MTYCNIEMGPSLLRYSFISDDRYVIVKRKNANGSKIPPKKKSISKTHSGNGSSVRYPDPNEKCSCSHISGALIQVLIIHPIIFPLIHFLIRHEVIIRQWCCRWNKESCIILNHLIGDVNNFRQLCRRTKDIRPIEGR